MSERVFRMGDKVTWTDVMPNGSGFRMTVKEGRVMANSGSLVSVKYRGRSRWIEASELRFANEPNTLTEAIFAAKKNL